MGPTQHTVPATPVLGRGTCRVHAKEAGRRGCGMRGGGVRLAQARGETGFGPSRSPGRRGRMQRCLSRRRENTEIREAGPHRARGAPLPHREVVSPGGEHSGRPAGRGWEGRVWGQLAGDRPRDGPGSQLLLPLAHQGCACHGSRWYMSRPCARASEPLELPAGHTSFQSFFRASVPPPSSCHVCAHPHSLDTAHGHFCAPRMVPQLC